MKLFPDSSVLLAACGSVAGASAEIFRLSGPNHWQLITTPFVIGEVEKNLSKMTPSATARWRELGSQLTPRQNILTLDWINVFGPAKDRPILFSALAYADVLLTLDTGDFQNMLGGQFFSLDILMPGDFLERERAHGRLTQ